MAVTPATNVILLGIGTGNNRSLSSEFRPLVLTAQETAMVATLHATDANTAWFCLAFNAKEAAFSSSCSPWSANGLRFPWFVGASIMRIEMSEKRKEYDWEFREGECPDRCGDG